jgi:lipopolysaccharide export system protein LptC
MSQARLQTRPAAQRAIAVGPTRARESTSAGRIARRRMLVLWSKWLLPFAALGLLASIALWPEFERETDEARVAISRLAHVEGSGRVIDARYQSVDAKGRPYTVTAKTAVQAGPLRVNLTSPKGDITLQNGSWMMVQSKDGVYMQHIGQLDLSGDVTLYRDDGTIIRSPTASIDLKRGGAAGANDVSAEGPFGTLDATGFAMLDKGSIIQFTGPAHLVLNQGKP